MEMKEKKSEYQTYMVRYYDDWHEDWNVLWDFKILKVIFEDCYEWERIAIRNDWTIWILKEKEVSWMYNPKNWGSRYSFNELWTREEILERIK
jgi:hypothetical protein